MKSKLMIQYLLLPPIPFLVCMYALDVTSDEYVAQHGKVVCLFLDSNEER